MSISWHPSEHHVTQSRPFMADLLPVTVEDAQWLDARGFGTYAQDWIQRAPGFSCYALPIYAPDGCVRGHVIRRPWDRSPLWYEGGAAPWAKKADTYKADPAAPLQSWYVRNPELPLVLVEDQLSAIKVASQGDIADAMAFLGVPRGGNCANGFARVREITREVAKRPEVVVALDADATADAFAFVRNWGAAFPSIRVAILEQDLKDTEPRDFRRVLGL